MKKQRYPSCPEFAAEQRRRAQQFAERQGAEAAANIAAVQAVRDQYRAMESAFIGSEFLPERPSVGYW